MKRLAIGVFAILALASPAGASNDDLFSQQWALVTMHAEAAWRAARGGGVVVAVVDTGVDLGHPDLKGRLVGGRDFVDGDSSPQDENGHGTHMAGSIAAVANNGIGIAGVAPEARIMPIRVLDESGRTDDPTIVGDGIRWAVDNGAKVVNLSLAADGLSPLGGQDLLGTAPIDLAIRDAVSRGAVVVIAAGNSESGGKSSTAYDATVEGALVVGASTKTDKRAAYSNYGEGLDVLAPGGGSATDPSFTTGCTTANAVVGLYWNPKSQASEYANACGTSVAVAQVSGIAAMLVEQGLTNVGTTQRISDTAVDLGVSGRDDATGYGRVDAARAVGVSSGGSPTGRATLQSSPTSKPGVGAAASTPASPSATPSAGASLSASPEPEHTPGVAAGPPPAAPDRSTPIAVAGALVFFTGWGFLTATGRPKRPAST